MRIALAQLNFHVGNFEMNLRKMLQAVDDAKAEGADIVCFSELAVCGYPARDFLEFDDFIRLCNDSVQALAEAAQDIAIVVGAPTVNPVVEGKDLYNSAYFLAYGGVYQVQHKTLLPTYDVFDEDRYFETATEHNVVHYQGHKIALSICEDLWNLGNENPLYTVCPLDILMEDEPDLILNISASPYNYHQHVERMHVIRENVRRYKLPMFYVNHVGAQTELIFAGGSVVLSPDAQVFDEFPYFRENLRVYDLEGVRSGRGEHRIAIDKIASIHDAIVMGIRDYFGKLGFRQAVLGLSGGIDSAVTAALACAALEPENVHGVLMPSPYSSEHSLIDARALAENLGMPHQTVPIERPFKAFLDLLEGPFEGKAENIAEENIQARCRGLILMALSNKHGYILLNTSNKSEIAVGYGTLYGDLCGGLSVIGDVYKNEVYALARHINRKGELIPQNSIAKAPTAELRPDQKDSDSLPDYDVLDAVLFNYIEGEKGPDEIIAMGYDPALVRRILRLVNINEFKRHQTAPILRVSTKAFGVGRRMPIVGKYLS